MKLNSHIQHQLGQHYSKEVELVNNYIKILSSLDMNKHTLVDPFCGEAHLLDFFLNLFDFETQLKLLSELKIKGYDIDNNNIIYNKQRYKEKYNLSDYILDNIFILNDSLLDDTKLPVDSFILTNPPYLAKNVCKKKFISDYNKYFFDTYKDFNDYYEISLSLYSKYSGIWIIPSNFLSSDIVKNIRKKILPFFEDIIVYKKKIFEDTDISVMTFYINLEKKSSYLKKISFISNTNTNSLSFEIDKTGALVKEWENIKQQKNSRQIKQGYISMKSGINKVLLLNEVYKEEEYYISDEDKQLLNNNVLILRATDTGSKHGKLGLYTIKELWGTEAIGVITKTTSRVYTQLFFKDLNIQQQLQLKEDFNKHINELRERYDSIFLTNYKNVSNNEQRKRISFKETFSLLNYLLSSNKYS